MNNLIKNEIKLYSEKYNKIYNLKIDTDYIKKSYKRFCWTITDYKLSVINIYIDLKEKSK